LLTSGEKEPPFLLTPESFDEKPGPDREPHSQKKKNKFHGGKGYTEKKQKGTDLFYYL
jgi:hypothetical protein